MTARRSLTHIFSGKPTIEGAGVRLHRVFGTHEVPRFDPFLMLDDFGSSNPDDYVAGFPWHPHRGIETVTYMLHGKVRHGDSMGNEGAIGSGQIQWMTAGRGIIHQEMPQRQRDFLRGVQLWVNLPAKHKMMVPRYQDLRADDVPQIRLEDDIKVKVLAGRFGDAQGPVKDIICDPEYLDVSVPADRIFDHTVAAGHTVFAYVFEGDAAFAAEGKKIGAGQLGLFGDGRGIRIQAGHHGVRFICVSGQPIGEPVAWRGPIVMNTEEELDVAFHEYHDGTFIK